MCRWFKPSRSRKDFIVRWSLFLCPMEQTMTISEQKQAMRGEMHLRLRAFCAENDVPGVSLAVRQAVLASEQFCRTDIVLGYFFHGDEADCTDVLYRALLQEKAAGVPRVVPHTPNMDFYLLDGTLPFGDQIERGAFGISEPVASLEKLPLSPALAQKRILMLVPGLAFTQDGRRLGRGKGFYDRYIARLRQTGADVTIAGFCFPCQIVDDLPTDRHDARMDIVFSAASPRNTRGNRANPQNTRSSR